MIRKLKWIAFNWLSSIGKPKPTQEKFDLDQFLKDYHSDVEAEQEMIRKSELKLKNKEASASQIIEQR